METGTTKISVKGKDVDVPSLQIDDFTVYVAGKWLKTAQIKDEFWTEGADAATHKAIIARLKESDLDADIFTFSQKLPHVQPEYDLPLAWDNVAAIPLSTYKEWWEGRLPTETRKNVRRSVKRGVVVRQAEFDDALIEGIVEMNNESPIRQGKPSWHYGKDFETVKKDYSDFLDRSGYLGAYYGDELIGFIRLVYTGCVVNIMQIMCKDKHYDKRPTNALMAKAVELCIDKGASYLVYGKYIYYGNDKSMLTEFKRRNGFEQILVPQYFVPLTAKGRIAIKLGLQTGAKTLLPKQLLNALRKVRARVYRMKLAENKAAV